MGRLGRGECSDYHGSIESEVHLTYFDTSSKKIARGAVYYDRAVAKIVARICTQIIMIYRSTHSLFLFFLFFSLFVFDAFALLRSLLLSFFWCFSCTHTHIRDETM